MGTPPLRRVPGGARTVGALAMSAAGLQNNNNELVRCIEDLKEKREEVHRQINKDEEEKSKVQNDLQVLTKRLSQLQAESERKRANLQEYDRTVQETEAAYMKILESSQTLLHVLKRETVSLSKKTGSRPGQMQLMG